VAGLSFELAGLSSDLVELSFELAGLSSDLVELPFELADFLDLGKFLGITFIVYMSNHNAWRENIINKR
jgi:hypothetical protein